MLPPGRGPEDLLTAGLLTQPIHEVLNPLIHLLTPLLELRQLVRRQNGLDLGPYLTPQQDSIPLSTRNLAGISLQGRLVGAIEDIIAKSLLGGSMFLGHALDVGLVIREDSRRISLN